MKTNLINIKIEGKEFQVAEGSTILAAARTHGFSIPTLCHTRKLEPFTSCFVCLVEVKGARGFVPSCSSVVTEGMEITIQNDNTFKARQAALELLASDHFGDCEPPCVTACPASVPIRDFLTLTAQGESTKAAQKIREVLPFPGSLGRVCPRFCEAKCRRSRVEESISICNMKRFVTDEETRQGGPFLPKPAADTGKHVAIIGAGPAGLTAAYFLRLKGHQVTVFEKHPAAGGMMKWGIPDYRLPPEVLSRECDSIISIGVELKTNVEIGKDLPFPKIREDHDAVFIAIGAQKASAMPLEGDSTISKSKMLSGIDFLEKVVKGSAPSLGKETVVVGGGNTAMDAARTALRLGAKVTLVYRRTEQEMPAHPMEIAEAKHEGVQMLFLANPVRVSEKDGKLEFECIRMQLGEPDSSGRRRPVPMAGSEFKLPADSCIMAIGQQVDASLVADSGLKISKYGNIEADPRTQATNVAGVFSGGDCAIGADVAVTAIAAGRRAAVSIDQFLSGQTVTGEKRQFNSSMGALETLPDSLFVGHSKDQRIEMPMLPATSRIRTFEEVETGFLKDKAISEAKRCLQCGCVESEDCKLREYCTEYEVTQKRYPGSHRGQENDASHAEVVLESGKCINCGICVRLLEKQGQHALSFIGRGFQARVGTSFKKSLAQMPAADFKEITEACPTAGIVSKSKYAARGIQVPKN